MSTLAVPSHDVARLAAWPDYEWATWLAEALRDAGVPVICEPGWQTNGRPRSVGTFTPRAMLWHHDASEVGASPEEAHFIGRVGRPAEGIPAPLAQLWVCLGCKGAHAVGTWHVLAAGRANHGGAGDGWGVIRAGEANADALGVETDHTTGEKWDPALLDSLRRGTAGIFKRAGWDPAHALAGHKEYAPGRKIDPDGLDMADERRHVAALIAQLHHPATGHQGDDVDQAPAAPARLAAAFPGKVFAIGKAHASVKLLRKWLKEAGYLDTAVPTTTLFDHKVKTAVKKFQKATPALKADADGIPGPVTWRLLRTAARHARAAARG